MDFSVIDGALIANLLLLLLIGMGPKIALVPFLEKTKGFDAERQREIGTRMVTVAVVTALILFATGAILMRLLHISSGAVSIAGGIVLMLLALKMALGSDPAHAEEEKAAIVDHHHLAVYPLAIPYLLNPVGIAVIIIASSKVESVLGGVVIVGMILLIGAFDMLVFRNIDKMSKRLSPTNLIVSEIVFGVLLTALAVELVVKGLTTFGIIEAVGGH